MCTQHPYADTGCIPEPTHRTGSTVSHLRKAEKETRGHSSDTCLDFLQTAGLTRLGDAFSLRRRLRGDHGGDHFCRHQDQLLPSSRWDFGVVERQPGGGRVRPEQERLGAPVKGRVREGKEPISSGCPISQAITPVLCHSLPTQPLRSSHKCCGGTRHIITYHHPHPRMRRELGCDSRNNIWPDGELAIDTRDASALRAKRIPTIQIQVIAGLPVLALSRPLNPSRGRKKRRGKNGKKG